MAASPSQELPSCTQVEANCAKSGWLFKQSKHVKKWNKRYFVLWPKEPKPNKGRLLFYYDSPQAARPRGLIPLVPKSFSSAIEAVSHDMQKGTTFKHYLQVNVCEPGSYQDIVASYVITEDDETLIEEWAQLIGGVGTAAAGSTPRSAGQQGMLLPEGTDLIDARVIFAAAEKGDIRALAQTSLKLVEGANKTIGALAQQYQQLQLENQQLKAGQPQSQ